MPTGAFIGLLRGINVGGHNRIPMADLRVACTELGWAGVQTYIQSGNIVFTADASAAELERAVERAIERRFALPIPVIVRSAADWLAYVQANPFADESRAEPKGVMLAVSKAVPAADAADRLQERAAAGERVVRTGDALWFHFVRGMGATKLTPSAIDRAVGSPATMRNWRTVLKLEELVRTRLAPDSHVLRREEVPQ